MKQKSCFTEFMGQTKNTRLLSFAAHRTAGASNAGTRDLCRIARGPQGSKWHLCIRQSKRRNGKHRGTGQVPRLPAHTRHSLRWGDTTRQGRSHSAVPDQENLILLLDAHGKGRWEPKTCSLDLCYEQLFWCHFSAHSKPHQPPHAHI